MFRKPEISAYTKRSHWQADDEKREEQLFRVLANGPRGWGDLLSQLKWHKQTLSEYLKSGVKNGYITKDERGIRTSYSLVRENAHVREILPSIANITSPRMELSAQDFIDEWLGTMRFEFVNILHDFELMGQEEEGSDEWRRIEGFTKAHIQGLDDVVNFYGNLLADRVRRRTLKPKKIMEVREKLYQQIKNEFEERVGK